MNIRKSLLPLAVLIGISSSVFADTVTTEASIARVTGQATVTLPDGSTVELKQGMKVPQGATIKTGADGDVYLESHAGYVTSIKKDSEVALAELSVTSEGGQVKEEKTLLDLKSGNLVAKLDPTKHAVNNYQVRTPKGVAAARGTVFTVAYEGTTYSIAVVNGKVDITPQGAAASGYQGGVNVTAGNALLRTDSGAQYIALSDLATYGQDTPAYKTYANNLSQLLAVAVATVAVAAQDHIGGTTNAEAAEVAKAILTAVPSVASEAAALISQSTKGQDNTAVVDAIKTVVPADQQSAFTQSIQTGTYTPTDTTPATTNSTTKSPTNTTPAATTPQPIDPSTVSRSG